MTPLHGIACFYDVGFGVWAVSRKTPIYFIISPKFSSFNCSDDTVVITGITDMTLSSDTNFEETLSTLKYAHTTKSVNNRPVMNIDQDPKDKMIRFF